MALNNSAPGIAPEVRILGRGSFAGARSSIGSYRITEDATPMDIQGIGGVGSISFEAVAVEELGGTLSLMGQEFEIYDPFAGVQRGLVTGLGISDGLTQVSGSPPTQKLVARKQAPGYSGSLHGAFVEYFALGGVEAGVVVDDSASWIIAQQVALPPWDAQVWSQVRKLAAIHGLEVAMVAGTYVIRARRLREIFPLESTPPQVTYDEGNPTHSVTVNYRVNQKKTNAAVYPVPDTSVPDRPIISVEASATTVQNYPVMAYLQSVNQPQHVMELPPVQDGIITNAYAVVDRDGVVVTPFDWANAGGALSVAIGEDGQSIDVTVRGMSVTERSPFRIASSSGDDEFQYSALQVSGTGIFFTEHSLTLHTGADPLTVAADEVTVIEDALVDSHATAVAMASAHVMANSGPRTSISFSTSKVTRRGEVGARVTMTFLEFAAEFGGLTFAQFSTEHGANTFQQFGELLYEDRSTDFANQAFGGVAGARVRHGDAYYRVDSVDISPSDYSLSASRDTTFADLSAMWSGETFQDFSDFWHTRTFRELGASPLAT